MTKRSPLASLMRLALPPILARLKRRNGRLIAQMYPGTTSRLIDLSGILEFVSGELGLGGGSRLYTALRDMIRVTQSLVCGLWIRGSDNQIIGDDSSFIFDSSTGTNIRFRTDAWNSSQAARAAILDSRAIILPDSRFQEQ